jgi:hypothetical protein
VGRFEPEPSRRRSGGFSGMKLRHRFARENPFITVDYDSSVC